MITETQRQARRGYLGGSDIGAIMGVDEHRTALDVFCSKVFDMPDEKNVAMQRGSLMEPIIRQIAADDLGIPITEEPETIFHPKHPFMAANIDGRTGDGGIFEAKLIDWRKAKALGEQGSDFCLPSHYYQVAHYLEVTGAPFAHVVYMISAFDFRYFVVQRDEEVGAAIVAKESAFWHNNVLARVPPESDDAEARMRYLAMEHGGNTKAAPLVVSAGTSAYEALAELRDARRNHAMSGVAVKMAAARVQAIMGDATKMTCDFGGVTWSARNKKGTRRFTATFDDALDGAEE